VVAAIYLDEFTDASAAAAGLINPLALRTGNPEFSVYHPTPQSLDGHLNAVNRVKLLGRERWAEVSVPRLHEVKRTTTQIVRQLPIAGLSAFERDQSASAIDAKPLAQALDLTDPEPQLLGGLPLRQAALQHAP
jgi:hypothetical protein